jgi:hypothetical protein
MTSIKVVWHPGKPLEIKGIIPVYIDDNVFLLNLVVFSVC